MKKSTRSILEELSNLRTSRDKEYLIECRGSNIIDSAINLLSLVRETYDPDIALDLERRFLNSIRTNDISKFKRGIKKIQEDKQ
jgi:hypothetical protein